MIVLLHGMAHRALATPSTPADDTFRIVVITLLPILAVPLVLRGRRAAAGLLALALAASWLYGVLNHFVLAGPDYVTLVDANAWHIVFVVTASLLGCIEAAGALLAAWLFWQLFPLLPRNPAARP